MQPDLVLVVDYGAQYAQLIARRVREAHVYSEIVPHTASVDELLARRPKAIILSGGPSSVYTPGAPQANAGLFAAGVPVFGICYGFQAMAQALGGEVANTGAREFGRTTLSVSTPGVLLRGLPSAQQVWMSHGDEVSVAPPGFVVTARTVGVPVAAFEDVDRRLAGVQFHPEVLHTEHGQQILRRFLYDIAGVRPQWTEANIIDEQVSAIQAQVGCARGRQSRSSATSSLPPASASRSSTRPGSSSTRWPESPSRRRSARRSGGSSSGSSRPPLARSWRTRLRRSSSSCRARCIRTSSSPAAVPAPQTSRATTTS